MMGFEEVMPIRWEPHADAAPENQQARRREIDRRNSEGVLLWHMRAFGDEVGAILGAEFCRNRGLR